MSVMMGFLTDQQQMRGAGPAPPGPATVADGSGAALPPKPVARRSRAPCWRSEARVARPVARPSPEARPVVRPSRDGRRKRDSSSTPPRTVGTPPTASPSQKTRTHRPFVCRPRCQAGATAGTAVAVAGRRTPCLTRATLDFCAEARGFAGTFTRPQAAPPRGVPRHNPGGAVPSIRMQALGRPPGATAVLMPTWLRCTDAGLQAGFSLVALMGADAISATSLLWCGLTMLPAMYMLQATRVPLCTRFLASNVAQLARFAVILLPGPRHDLHGCNDYLLRLSPRDLTVLFSAIKVLQASYHVDTMLFSHPLVGCSSLWGHVAGLGHGAYEVSSELDVRFNGRSLDALSGPV
eukprot:365043-Chlamydomonas_euryale.AAC.23